jgi:plasmid stability protein
MPVLYVENVPKELYEALRARARKRRTSTAAEMMELLKANFPTAAEIQRRKRAHEQLLSLQDRAPLAPGPFPSTEEMIREDRDR